MAETEKVELTEQTPLKSDTDLPAGATETTVETKEVKEEKPSGKQRTWFFKKTTKKTETTEKVLPIEGESGGVLVENQNGEKKAHWWNCKKKETIKEGDNEEMSIGLSMFHRDDKNLHTTIDLGFEDIYGEPDAVHSIDSVWRITFRIFTALRAFFYKLFSLIIAIPSAIIFAILFALVSALHVFCCTPLGRLVSIPFGWLAKVWQVLINTVFNPLFTACGLCCGSISIRRYGLNSDVTAQLVA